jgi:hypothetical protein
MQITHADTLTETIGYVIRMLTLTGTNGEGTTVTEDDVILRYGRTALELIGLTTAMSASRAPTRGGGVSTTVDGMIMLKGISHLKERPYQPMPKEMMNGNPAKELGGDFMSVHAEGNMRVEPKMADCTTSIMNRLGVEGAETGPSPRPEPKAGLRRPPALAELMNVILIFVTWDCISGKIMA